MRPLLAVLVVGIFLSSAALGTTFTSTAPNGTQNLFPTNGSVSLTGGSISLDGSQVDRYVFQELAGSVFTVDLTQAGGQLSMLTTDPGGTVIATATAPNGGNQTFSLVNVPVPSTGDYTLAIESPCVGCAGTASYQFTIDKTASTAVPEPASFLLLGSGLAGFAGAIRRKPIS